MCAACAGGSPEATLLEDFFAAARLQDTAALSSLAETSFNPRVDGSVRRFRITKVAPLPGGREEVAVDADVLTPAGRTEERRLQVTLTRPSADGRWMVAGIR